MRALSTFIIKLLGCYFAPFARHKFLTISVQKRIHRGDAEYAEKRILSSKTPNSATSVPLR